MSARSSVHELPEDLPEGEHVLWQGAPAWWPLTRALHVRLVAVYLGASLAWFAAARFGHAGWLPDFARLAGLSAAVVGLFALYAFLVCLTTSYTLTNRRFVLHTGIALPISFNIPFSAVARADLSRNPDGSGDIVLAVTSEKRLSYPVIWPHARPWRFSRPQPMMRAVAGIDHVAAVLAHQLDGAVPAARPAGAPAAAPVYAPAGVTATA